LNKFLFDALGTLTKKLWITDETTTLCEGRKKGMQ
jgi:hypothetical protein